MNTEYEKKHKKLIKTNYIVLTEIGIPSEILDNLKNWFFFLQEGWCGEINWRYQDYLSKPEIIKLYWLIKTNHIESELTNEIEIAYNL